MLFIYIAVGVDTDEDYIEVVPLSHDEFKRYEEVYEEDAFSPLDTGVCNEDRDDDIEGVETENSEQSIQHQESQVPERERSSERISGCGDINKLESPIKELALRKRKRKCDEDLISNSIEGNGRSHCISPCTHENMLWHCSRNNNKLVFVFHDNCRMTSDYFVTLLTVKVSKY